MDSNWQKVYKMYRNRREGFPILEYKCGCRVQDGDNGYHFYIRCRELEQIRDEYFRLQGAIRKYDICKEQWIASGMSRDRWQYNRDTLERKMIELSVQHNNHLDGTNWKIWRPSWTK